MQATDVLRTEHEVIQQVLDCLDELAERAARSGVLDVVAVRDALDFLGGFADRCHHGKEELHLFRALEQKGMPRHVGPVAVMLAEHERGRAAVQRMRVELLEAEMGVAGAAQRFATSARSYVELLRAHIDKENGVLFPIADQMLTELDQRAVFAGFAEIEHREMGARTHEHYIAMAYALCDRLDIAWAPHFALAHACCVQHGNCC